MSQPELRQSGQTSQQMLDAPLRAVFVWKSSKGLEYPRLLARHLDRADLLVIGPDELTTLAGHSLTGLVVDHAAQLTPLQAAAVDRLMTLNVGKLVSAGTPQPGVSPVSDNRASVQSLNTLDLIKRQFLGLYGEYIVGIVLMGKHLIVATANGLYRVDPDNGTVEPLLLRKL